MSEKPNCKIFAIKTTGGQEKIVANLVANRISMRKLPICSILVLDSIKGYILLEADNAQIVNEAVSSLKHVKGQVPGLIQHEDIEKFLITKPIINELNMDDIVEIIAGPFKGMKAKINRIEVARSEATIILLDAPYQLPVTIDANYLKILSHSESEKT
ncbi:MAG: transcription elongation factor Spt5 [Candidatus Methylarchaceae archaeon HK01B]|nr:transcription elongation factor Spt5 [Candidatus Methylarchaceae archaeon HK01B]